MQIALTVMQTNENYLIVRNVPFALLFSRGGFLTSVAQAGPHEKTLLGVLLEPLVVCSHMPGIPRAEVRGLLAAQLLRPIGSLVLLKWGQTLSFYRPGTNRVLTIRAELCDHFNVAAAGQPPDYVPDEVDSPPPFNEEAESHTALNLWQ